MSMRQVVPETGTLVFSFASIFLIEQKL